MSTADFEDGGIKVIADQKKLAKAAILRLERTGQER
jgi:hypothetical protein